MGLELTAKQALCIFSLLFGQTAREREPTLSQLVPALSAKDRRRLISAGLLETQRRGRATHFIATDAAWEWAGAHLDAELPASNGAAPVLHNLLVHLGRFLAERKLALADVVTAKADAGPPCVRGRIVDTVLVLGGGRSKQRVRLAALRSQLPELPRAELDSLLREMQRDQKLVLYRLDNPAELRPADEAAVLIIGGNPRHLVYLEG